MNRKTFLKQISPQKATYMMYYHILKSNDRKGYSQNYQDKVINVLKPVYEAGSFSNFVETPFGDNFGNACYTLDHWGVITRDGTGYHELTKNSYRIFEEKIGHNYLNTFLSHIESANTIAKLEREVEVKDLQIKSLKQKLEEINKLSVA